MPSDHTHLPSLPYCSTRPRTLPDESTLNLAYFSLACGILQVPAFCLLAFVAVSLGGGFEGSVSISPLASFILAILTLTLPGLALATGILALRRIHAAARGNAGLVPAVIGTCLGALAIGYLILCFVISLFS